MTDTVADAPVYLRASISRDELRELKAAAAMAGLSLQDFLAELIRQRITTREG